MRKFVVKNRQKRKYTRKSEEKSSFSFSKTAYSMTPLLIMLIAFMSTLVISAPVRVALTNVKFTFELPQFSITNPFGFFQTVSSDIFQMGFVVWTIVQMTGAATFHFIISLIGEITYATFLFGNFILLCGNSVWNACLFLLKDTTNVLIIASRFLSASAFAFIEILDSFASSIGNATAIAGQYILSTTILIYQQAVNFLFVMLNFVIFITMLIVHFVIFMGQTIVQTFASAIHFIGSVIYRTSLAIIHTIEIPFKILYAFGLILKPYVDFFGRHINMSLNDFSNMTLSFNRIASSLHGTK